MTELQAWKHLEKLWSKPGHEGDDFFVTYNGHHASGLCVVISWFENDGLITESVARTMIRRFGRKKIFGWLWPTNAKGAAARIRFCRKCIRSCSKTLSNK